MSRCQPRRSARKTYGRAEAPAARGHIIVDGVDQGTDPDPIVRMQILRDPPIGG